MKLTKLKLAAIAAAAIALSACGNDKAADNAQAAEQQHIRIATESSFKPFSYLDTDGKVVGFEIDLANALCEEMKAKCDIESIDWDGLIPSLQTEKHDAIMAGMSITEERKKVVDFTDSYFDNKLILIASKDSNITLNDIAGKTVAAQKATLAADYIKQQHADAKLNTYDKQDEAYLDLAAGRADAMMSDIAPASDWLKSEQGQAFEIKGDIIDTEDQIGIAVRKGDALKDQFNAALKTLKENGKYDEITAKHLGTGK